MWDGFITYNKHRIFKAVESNSYNLFHLYTGKYRKFLQFANNESRFTLDIETWYGLSLHWSWRLSSSYDLDSPYHAIKSL